MTIDEGEEEEEEENNDVDIDEEKDEEKQKKEEEEEENRVECWTLSLHVVVEISILLQPRIFQDLTSILRQDLEIAICANLRRDSVHFLTVIAENKIPENSNRTLRH